jgi:hypothetical protein
LKIGFEFIFVKEVEKNEERGGVGWEQFSLSLVPFKFLPFSSFWFAIK